MGVGEVQSPRRVHITPQWWEEELEMPALLSITHKSVPYSIANTQEYHVHMYHVIHVQ